MTFLDFNLFERLGEKTMSLFNKFLIGDWTIFDKYLFLLTPLLVVVFSILNKTFNIKDYLIRTFWTIFSIIFTVIIGLITALYSWQSLEGDYMELPKNIKHQPFSFYWTLFILLGIMIPNLTFLLKRRHKAIHNQTIDN